MAWFRLDADSADHGWTGDLPLDQWGAWVKLLCAVKNAGYRGELRKSRMTEGTLRRKQIDLDVWDAMLQAAIEGGAVEETPDSWIVQNWTTYQPDHTNAERQRRYRETKKQSNGAVTLRNGSNEDSTGQYSTVQYKEPPLTPPAFGGFEKPQHSESLEQPAWLTEALEKIQAHIRPILGAWYRSHITETANLLRDGAPVEDFLLLEPQDVNAAEKAANGKQIFINSLLEARRSRIRREGKVGTRSPAKVVESKPDPEAARVAGEIQAARPHLKPAKVAYLAGQVLGGEKTKEAVIAENGPRPTAHSPPGSSAKGGRSD